MLISKFWQHGLCTQINEARQIGVVQTKNSISDTFLDDDGQIVRSQKCTINCAPARSDLDWIGCKMYSFAYSSKCFRANGGHFYYYSTITSEAANKHLNKGIREDFFV